MVIILTIGVFISSSCPTIRIWYPLPSSSILHLIWLALASSLDPTGSHYQLTILPLFTLLISIIWLNLHMHRSTRQSRLLFGFENSSAVWSSQIFSRACLIRTSLPFLSATEPSITFAISVGSITCTIAGNSIKPRRHSIRSDLSSESVGSYFQPIEYHEGYYSYGSVSPSLHPIIV